VKVIALLGPKSWFYIGSEGAGSRFAAIVSIVETCRRLNIPVREYRGSVLLDLANFSTNRIDELTPIALGGEASERAKKLLFEGLAVRTFFGRRSIESFRVCAAAHRYMMEGDA